MEGTHINVGFLWLIPFFPLVGAFINGTVGWLLQERVGKWLNGVIANVAVWASFVTAVAGFFMLVGQEPEHRALVNHLYSWIAVGGFEVSISFTMDPLSAIMALVVTGVGGLIHIYSIGYIAHDKSVWRYFSYLNLFSFAMLVLVLSSNLLLMFVGWEGVGLCSYLLIGFWFGDVEKAKAGMKAFVVNRVGDFGFLAGMMFLLWGLAGGWADGHYVASADHFSFDFNFLAESVGALAGKQVLGISLVTVVCVALFVGATGQSAQIPLYVWLPDAMAGPTPVSALIHAATMVTAGVYMIARLNFLYVLSPVAMTIVSGIGALTALFAATIGFTQRDIKKVLAYSTVSQLGYMFVGVGVGAFTAGVFHLMTHAFFKACLFLGSGSVIHAMSGEQDIFKMGGLRKKIPITFWTFLIATLAIAGFPPFAAFFSKDEILWKAFDTANPVIPWWPYFVWGLGALAALGTAFYMFRLVYITFFGECRADEEVQHHIHESPPTMTFALVVLAVLSTIGGWVGMPHLFHVPNVFEHWLEPVFEHSAAHLSSRGAGTGVEWFLMGFSVLLAFAGWFAARYIYENGRLDRAKEIVARIQGLYRWSYNKYYVDEFYQAVVVRPLLVLTRALYWFDQRVVDGLVNLTGWMTTAFANFDGAIDKYVVDGAVNLVGNSMIGAGRYLKKIQTGRLQDYIYVMVGGVLLVIFLSGLLAGAV